MPALYSYLTTSRFRTFQRYPALTAQYKVQTRRFKAWLGPLLIFSCLPCLCCLTQSPPDRAHPAGRVASIHLYSLTSSRKPGADQASNSTGEGKICPSRMCLRAPSSLLPQYSPSPTTRLVKLFFPALPFPCPCTLIPTTEIHPPSSRPCSHFKKPQIPPTPQLPCADLSKKELLCLLPTRASLAPKVSQAAQKGKPFVSKVH